MKKEQQYYAKSLHYIPMAILNKDIVADHSLYICLRYIICIARLRPTILTANRYTISGKMFCPPFVLCGNACDRSFAKFNRLV